MTETTTAVYGRVLAVVLVCSVVLGPVAGVMGTSANEATIDSITIQTAPKASFDHLDASNIAEFTTDDTIAIGDVLILRLSISGLSDALDGNDNSDSTERRFLELVQSGLIDLRIKQTNAVSGDGKTFNISATIANGGLEVFYEENTMYVAIDTGRAVFDQGGTTVGIAAGERFSATVTDVSGTTVSASFQIVPRTVSFDTSDSGTVVVEGAPNQTVTGETTVAPGTDLTIRARSDGQSSFVITQTVQVRTDGTFELEFDFTNIAHGISFKLTVLNQGFENDESISGVVRRPPTATIFAGDSRSNSERIRTVTIKSVNLSDGGFVAIYDQSFPSNDTVTASPSSFRGVSEYLTPGKHTTVKIKLNRPYTHNGTIVIVPHQDTNNDKQYDFITSNGSEDSPYLGADGDPIVASVNIVITPNQTADATGLGHNIKTEARPGTSTDTDSPPYPHATDMVMTTTVSSKTNLDKTAEMMNEETTPSASDTGSEGGNTRNEQESERGSGMVDTTTSKRETDASPQNTTTEALGPGFGFVVGLVALCVAALLATRRDG